MKTKVLYVFLIAVVLLAACGGGDDRPIFNDPDPFSGIACDVQAGEKIGTTGETAEYWAGSSETIIYEEVVTSPGCVGWRAR